ncbi:MAG: ABC transporter permease [Puia sp.]|nr:ABC transporter permease [Puia sp.]
MFTNYFKIAWRNLLKNKVFSIVNIFGLAIGMAAGFFIFLYVHFETGYDRFNKHAADLYRVTLSFRGSINDYGTEATNDPAVGPAMKAEFPEVIDFARIVPVSLFMNAFTIAYKDNPAGTITFNEDKVFLSDSSFPKLFTYPFIRGNPEKALTQANTVVISESEAKKYFGETEPIGKTLYLNQVRPLKVTGVFRDVPGNSHLRFNMLISSLTFRDIMDDASWEWPEFYTYVLLAPGSTPKSVEDKLPAFVDRHMGALMKKEDFHAEFHLQRITDIHLEKNYNKEPEVGGNKNEINLLSLIGVFILVIAWINYVNLTTAKSIERSKEVGLRKVAGATRMQLIRQFIVESAVVNLLALAVSLLIVLAGEPWFNRLTGKNIAPVLLAAGLLRDPWFWLRLAGIFVAGAVLVGAYPAFVLSGFRPALVLKGQFQRSGKGISLRRILVSFQFILSILLISATAIVYKQLSYMRNQSLGYNRDQMIIVKAPPASDSSYTGKLGSFWNEIHRNPSINNITRSSDIPGQMIVYQNSVRKSADDQTHNFNTYLVETDENFIKTFQMELAAGRDFEAGDTMHFSNTGKPAVIVNEEVVKGLGYPSNPASINQELILQMGREVRVRIVGVVKNYHQRSLKEAYQPILYFFPDQTSWKYFSLNVNTYGLPQNIASIEGLYKHFFPGHPFEYFFLNEYFDRQYQSDLQFGKIFGCFTLLAIFVACLGLLGLSSFAISHRTKEIGIRKVLGATVSSIVILFSRDFIRLVCLSAVIAIPVIYFLGNEWLSHYAFRTRLNWFVFFMPPVLLLIIAVATVSLQSLKTAIANPVKSLRTD